MNYYYFNAALTTQTYRVSGQQRVVFRHPVLERTAAWGCIDAGSSCLELIRIEKVFKIRSVYILLHEMFGCI